MIGIIFLSIDYCSRRMSEIRRKRNRDPLAKTEHEKLYEPESQGKKCYLEGGLSLKV